MVCVTAVYATGAGFWDLGSRASGLWLELPRWICQRTRGRSPLEKINGTASLDPCEAALCLLAIAVEAKDPTLKGHCARLAHYAVGLGRALGLDAATLVALRRGAVLHDIGKIWIPDAILLKPGPLTPEEWDVVREHPVIGEEICRPVNGLQDVLPIIRHHHERPDGSGYPDGLARPAIPLTAQVLQVADVFDALTSPRPYRDPLLPDVALCWLRAKAARGFFDADLVHSFGRLWATGELSQAVSPAHL